MLSLYVCSADTAAGKTSLSVGLLRRLARDVGPTGYFKPVGNVAGKAEDYAQIDEDAIFLKQGLGLPEPLAILSPVVLSPESKPQTQGASQPEIAQRIKDAFDFIAAGKAAVIAEAPATLAVGASFGIPPGKVAEMLGARALLVARYRGEATLDDARAGREAFGQALLGVVINAVPTEHAEYVRNRLARQIEEAGATVFGVVPQERGLMGATVRELAEALAGPVLCCEAHLDRLVESLMIGARSFNTGLPYFQRRRDKAVISGADRPDIQLAALETSTSCLVVTDGAIPDEIVLARARETKVPVIRVELDTASTMEVLDQFLGQVRFRHSQRIERLERGLDGGLDFGKLYQALGVAARA